MNYKINEQFGHWKLIENIGEGGNGEVWKTKSVNYDEEYAIKILKSNDKEKLNRFKEEINLINQSSNKIKNIISIIDYDNSDTPKWFVMPICKNSVEFIKNKSLFEKIKLFVDIVHSVVELHNINITHRDIKPANILLLNDKLVLADFGLGHRPTRENNWTIESKRKGLGAMSTIAPEMRRYSAKDPVENYKAADVYSLAKTLWIFITNKDLGFDGEYVKKSSLSISNYIEQECVPSIENLLLISTKTDPALRPNIEQFYEEIENIAKVMNNYKYNNQVYWSEVISKIFPVSTPKQASWENDDVFEVLSTIIKSGHYTFHPTGGGYTYYQIIRDNNNNIKLNVKYSKTYLIIRKSILTFHSFPQSPNLNYFRLECEYKENRIRKFNEGVFLFFSKSSLYNTNQMENTQHHEISDKEFRCFIEDFIQWISQIDLKSI